MDADDRGIPDHLRQIHERWVRLSRVATGAVDLIYKALNTHPHFTLTSKEGFTLRFTYLGGSYELAWFWSRARDEGRIRCLRIEQTGLTVPNRTRVAEYYFDGLGNFGRDYPTAEVAKLLGDIRRDILKWISMQDTSKDFAPL